MFRLSHISIRKIVQSTPIHRTTYPCTQHIGNSISRKFSESSKSDTIKGSDSGKVDKSVNETTSTTAVNKSNKPTPNSETLLKDSGSPQKSGSQLHRAASTVGATLHYADQTLHTAAHFAGQTYEEIERRIMTSLKESNQRRFRIMLLSALVAIIWVSAVFGARIRKSVTEQTADLAKETLENESLKVQTQELAMAVVQTVLNDKEITAHAAAFLKEASVAPETQAALLQLTVHILQHEETLAQLTALGKKLIADLADDKDTSAKCADLLSGVLADPQLKQAAAALVAELCKEPAVLRAVTDLALKVIARDDIYNATTELLVKSSTKLLADETVQEESREFVAEVMGDDKLQREGGDALWNSVRHALKPGFIRITGACIVGMSVAAIKILLSPF